MLTHEERANSIRSRGDGTNRHRSRGQQDDFEPYEPPSTPTFQIPLLIVILVSFCFLFGHPEKIGV
jgi:hypothetical protein